MSSVVAAFWPAHCAWADRWLALPRLEARALAVHRLGLGVVVVLSLGLGACAQAASEPAADRVAAAHAVGHWLHDAKGDIIGSVRSLDDGGRTAIIMVGSYYQDGSHEAKIPARAVSLMDGRATLDAKTWEALNAGSQK